MLEMTPSPLAPPEPGESLTIHPAIEWIRMPLPIRLNHVNVWALRDGEGRDQEKQESDSWCLIDTGFNNTQTRQAWDQLLEKFLKTGPVRQVIATHYHPDHCGLSGHLVERTGAKFHMPEAEYLTSSLLRNIPSDINAMQINAFCRRCGFPPLEADQMEAIGPHYTATVGPLPSSSSPLEDKTHISINGVKWQVITGYGHAIAHASLYSPDLKVLIAGDHVLPEITPNISVHWFNNWSDPLGGFLETCQRLRQIVDDNVLVLPSHRQPFTGLYSRLAEMVAHHDERLDVTRAALRGMKGQTGTAYDVLPIMFKMDLDLFGQMFAIGEAEAHLRHLVTLGQAEYVNKSWETSKLWQYRLCE